MYNSNIKKPRNSSAKKTMCYEIDKGNSSNPRP